MTDANDTMTGISVGQAASQQAMRRHNLSLALRTIVQRGAISRTELARTLSLSKPAIGRIVNDLTDAGYVSETEARPASGRGRPSTAISLRAGQHYFIGVDFRVDRLAIQARDLAGEVLYNHHFPVARTAPAEQVVATLARRIRSLEAAVGGLPSGIGVSLPAEFDDPGTTVVRSLYFEWQHVPFHSLLQQALGSDSPPILISDISSCAAIATWREVARSGATDVAHLQIGIGAGVGLAGRDFPIGRRPRLFRRFGHLPLDRGGARCKCGAAGCLDAVAGFDALLRYAAPTGLTVGRRSEAISDYCTALLARSLHGDVAASYAISTVAEWFGRAAATVINLVNPSRITLGGYPLHLGDAFLDPFLEAIEPFAPGGSELVVATSLGDEASVVGAVLLAMHPAMSDPLSNSSTLTDSRPERAPSATERL